MTTGFCIYCRRPVCVTCMELRGYFCSDACKAAYLSSKPAAQSEPEPGQPSEAQISQWAQHGNVMATWLFKRIPLGLLACAACAGALAYFDTSGDELWSVRPARAALFTEVVVAGDTVLVRCKDGKCLSLASDTGAERWKSQPSQDSGPEFGWLDLFGSSPFSGLQVADELVLCGSPSSVSVLMAETGQTLWDRQRGGFAPKLAVLRNGRVLMADADSPDQGSGAARTGLVCVDARSGKELWHRSFEGREIRAADAAGDICFCMTCLPLGAEKRQTSPRPTGSETAIEPYASERAPGSAYEMNVIRFADGAPLWSARMPTGTLDQIRLLDDRIVALAGTHLYVLSTDGEKLAHARLPANTCRTCLSDDYAAAATADGRLVVLSTRDGRTAWTRAIGGSASSLELASDSLYVVAGIVREAADKLPDGTPIAPAPRSAHQQLLEEVQATFEGTGSAADGDKSPRSRTECRTLINLRLSDGQERWRRQPLVEDLHVLPDGNCLLLNTAIGGVSLFQTADGAFLTEHLQKSGKEVWKHKLPGSVLSVKADSRSIYLLTIGDRVKPKKGQKASEGDGALRVLRRRTLLNQARIL